MRTIRRVAVLGAGTMGSRIAAHFANAGIPSLLLDIVIPSEKSRNAAALKGIEHADPAICVNVIVGLIKVTHYLLEKQLHRLETDFLKEGGLRERMTRSRLVARAKR